MSKTEKKLSTSTKMKSEATQVESETDSSISLTFDSQSDCGYKSGEINSSLISSSQCLSGSCTSDVQKLDQSAVFDSGLIADCFSPTSTESISFEKTEIKATYRESHVKEKYEVKDTFTQDKDGDTILHLAIVEAHSDIIFPLIQLAMHPDLLDITNNLFQTSLHLASLTGKSNIVRRLVVAGATLDIQDHNGNTALHIASRRGDLDCVQSIMAPITKAEVVEARCLYQIYVQDHDLSHLIDMKNYEGLTCVHYAAEGGFLKVMECLYSNHADINALDGKTGRTALHYAVENSNAKLVDLLVSTCHANPRMRSYGGRTPLQIARSLRDRNPSRVRRDIAELLTAAGGQESSSDYDSDASGDEVDLDSLLQSSRNAFANKGC